MPSSEELRRHIRLTQRLIERKKAQLPDLRKRLMWALADEVTPAQKEKFIKLYNDCVKQDRVKLDELIGILDRTIAMNSKNAIVQKLNEELELQ